VSLRLAVVALLVAGFATPLAGQDSLAARLAGRVPPEVVRAVKQLAASSTARDVPVEPLVQKAIEGGAKGVSAERVVAALRQLAGELEASASALHTAGIEHPAAEVVEGGAYSLDAGLSAADVRDMARASHPPYDPAMTLRVAATLAALGVPAKATVQLVLDMISAGRPPADLVSLPGEVQAQVARGATPAQAANGVGPRGAHTPPAQQPGWVPPGQAKPRNPHKP
jgi:hypothetical protein